MRLEREERTELFVKVLIPKLEILFLSQWAMKGHQWVLNTVPYSKDTMRMLSIIIG